MIRQINTGKSAIRTHRSYESSFESWNLERADIACSDGARRSEWIKLGASSLLAAGFLGIAGADGGTRRTLDVSGVRPSSPLNALDLQSAASGITDLNQLLFRGLG
jgi:hypothetical protein